MKLKRYSTIEVESMKALDDWERMVCLHTDVAAMESALKAQAEKIKRLREALEKDVFFILNIMVAQRMLILPAQPSPRKTPQRREGRWHGSAR
jgi:hypothetical protein